jgi:predicted kinase
MSKCYQLIGVPGSGKSTWIKNQVQLLGLTVVSTDNFVEAYAAAQGKTYNEVFHEYMPEAVKLMTEQVQVARGAGHDIIWDQTSTTVASRRRKFRMLPKYEHFAVVFTTPEPDELDRRLMSRLGKSIPKHVMDRMIRDFEMPTLDEGFVDIKVVSTVET